MSLSEPRNSRDVMQERYSISVGDPRGSSGGRQSLDNSVISAANHHFFPPRRPGSPKGTMHQKMLINRHFYLGLPVPAAWYAPCWTPSKCSQENTTQRLVGSLHGRPN